MNNFESLITEDSTKEMILMEVGMLYFKLGLMPPLDLRNQDVDKLLWIHSECLIEMEKRWSKCG